MDHTHTQSKGAFLTCVLSRYDVPVQRKLLKPGQGARRRYQLCLPLPVWVLEVPQLPLVDNETQPLCSTRPGTHPFYRWVGWSIMVLLVCPTEGPIPFLWWQIFLHWDSNPAHSLVRQASFLNHCSHLSPSLFHLLFLIHLIDFFNHPTFENGRVCAWQCFTSPPSLSLYLSISLLHSLSIPFLSPPRSLISSLIQSLSLSSDQLL